MDRDLRAIGQKVQGEHTTVLLIYDSDGNLVAESNGASEFAFHPEQQVSAAEPESPRPADAAAVPASVLTSWVANQLDLARKQESYGAKSCLEHPGGRVDVRIETLKFMDHGNRFAVFISPSEDSNPEGSSLITRQQWHDIKNHLGGLKLYATFLKKKISDSEDQAIIEKLLNGINGLIDHLAQIRGGDAK